MVVRAPGGTNRDLIAAEGASLAIDPTFERDWSQGASLTRDPWCQPVSLVGAPAPTLRIEIGLPGLFRASTADIHPDDRGASVALELGRRVASDTVAWSRLSSSERSQGPGLAQDRP